MSEVKLKDPDGVVDWTHDWSDWLSGSETIASSSWTVEPSGELTVDSDSKTTTTTTVWLSAGNRRGVYRVINSITTNSNPARSTDRTIVVRVEEK